METTHKEKDLRHHTNVKPLSYKSTRVHELICMPRFLPPIFSPIWITWLLQKTDSLVDYQFPCSASSLSHSVQAHEKKVGFQCVHGCVWHCAVNEHSGEELHLPYVLLHWNDHRLKQNSNPDYIWHFRTENFHRLSGAQGKKT